MILTIAHALFTALIGASIFLCLYRLWQGPTIADRINAADVIALGFVGLAIGHGWKTGNAVWLDLALVAGLVLFVGTTAVSLFISPEHLAGGEDEE